MAYTTKKRATKKTANRLAGAMTGKWNRSARTENGAVSLRTSLKDTVDFFSKSAAIRGNDKYAWELFSNALKEDREVAMKTLFYTRDIRGGQGERRTFKTIVKNLACEDPDVVRANFDNIVEFGRWDDLLSLVGTPLEKQAFDYISDQIESDARSVETGEGNPSLLAKWMPSENASSKQTKNLARKIRQHIGYSPRQYRKVLSLVRNQLKLVETDMSNREFQAIDYERVPSKAALKYRKGFLRNDENRYRQYLSDVSKGEKKINASTLYPYDLANKYLQGYSRHFNPDTTVEQLWNNLPDYLKDNPHNGLVMADTSGSMSSSYFGGPTPISVALSLAVYYAERNTGDFKDLFMTYSSSPSFHKLKGSTLAEKLRSILETGEHYGSTDLQKAFDRLLRLAIDNRIEQSEMPEVVYIVSDMQFNQCMGGYTNFESIKDKFKRAGYEMPRLVFWNVNARADQPVTFDEKGTALVSGCSPSILKTVLCGTTPEETMKATVLTERYSKVKY